MKNRLDLNKFKESSVGTTVESSSESLKVDMKYSGLSWFFITFFGTTRVPEKIIFTCLKTEEIFETLTEKNIIQYYITYRKK